MLRIHQAKSIDVFICFMYNAFFLLIIHYCEQQRSLKLDKKFFDICGSFTIGKTYFLLNINNFKRVIC